MALCLSCAGTGRSQAQLDAGLGSGTCMTCMGTGTVPEKKTPRRPEIRAEPRPPEQTKLKPAASSKKEETTSTSAEQSGKWTLLGVLGGGGWAFTQFGGEDRWFAIGFVALISGFIVGKFYRLLIVLAAIFGALWAYGWYMTEFGS